MNAFSNNFLDLNFLTLNGSLLIVTDCVLYDDNQLFLDCLIVELLLKFSTLFDNIKKLTSLVLFKLKFTRHSVK